MDLSEPHSNFKRSAGNTREFPWREGQRDKSSTVPAIPLHPQGQLPELESLLPEDDDPEDELLPELPDEGAEPDEPEDPEEELPELLELEELGPEEEPEELDELLLLLELDNELDELELDELELEELEPDEPEKLELDELLLEDEELLHDDSQHPSPSASTSHLQLSANRLAMPYVPAGTLVGLPHSQQFPDSV